MTTRVGRHVVFAADVTGSATKVVFVSKKIADSIMKHFTVIIRWMFILWAD